jgi:hypothetical protein
LEKGRGFFFRHIAIVVALLFSMMPLSAKIFTEEEVANSIIKASEKYNINPKILYTLASIESNFHPMVITVETTEESARVLSTLRRAGVRVVFSPKAKTFHSGLSIIDIYPDSTEIASYIIKLLKKHKFCFDVGLMQINTVNFSVKEAEKMYYPEKNIDRAARVFAGCQKRFNSIIHQVECYNRGAGNLKSALRKNKRYYPYWRRFRRHYKNYFGRNP